MTKNRNNNNRRNNNKENTADVLPSSQILEKFEDAVPTSVTDLVEMAKKEQDHRHTWQTNFCATHDKTFRIGQIFGLIYNLGLLYVVYDLIKSGKTELALQIFVINAILIAFAIIVTTTERRITSRRPVKNPKNRRSNKRDPRKKPSPAKGRK